MSLILSRRVRNASDRLKKMGDIIYSYGVERFGVKDRKSTISQVKTAKRNGEIG